MYFSYYIVWLNCSNKLRFSLIPSLNLNYKFSRNSFSLKGNKKKKDI